MMHVACLDAFDSRSLLFVAVGRGAAFCKCTRKVCCRLPHDCLMQELRLLRQKPLRCTKRLGAFMHLRMQRFCAPGARHSAQLRRYHGHGTKNRLGRSGSSRRWPRMTRVDQIVDPLVPGKGNMLGGIQYRCWNEGAS